MELTIIKADLGITHNLKDDLIRSEYEACKEDLKRAGIKVNETDSLVQSMVRLYMRAMHNFQNQGDLYYQRYEAMKDAVSMNSERKIDNGRSNKAD